MFTEIDVTEAIAHALDDEGTIAYENIVDETLVTPSAFPCASIIEMDTYFDLRYVPMTNKHTHRQSTFEVQVYVNDITGGKYHASQIMDSIVEKFSGLGYRCMANMPVANLEDTSIKRRVARFTRVIGEDDTLPSL